MKTLHLLTTTAAAMVSASIAQAGGYVVPIIEAVPQVVATGGGGQTQWAWLALPALLLLFRGGGSDRATLPPGDHGGPCFREGTLIETPSGWVRVEDLKEGSIVSTSKGPQPALSVDSWVPTEYKDRPAVFGGVHISKNHCVMVDGKRVPAEQATSVRDMISGARYYHILVADHAWLSAAAKGMKAIAAESLMLTVDIKALADRFPHLIQRHADSPCDTCSEFA